MNTNKSKIAKNYFGQDTGTVRWLIHLNNEADDIRKSKCLCQSYLELTKQYSGLMKCLRLCDCHRIPIVGIVDLDNIIYTMAGETEWDENKQKNRTRNLHYWMIEELKNLVSLHETLLEGGDINMGVHTFLTQIRAVEDTFFLE